MEIANSILDSGATQGRSNGNQLPVLTGLLRTMEIQWGVTTLQMGPGRRSGDPRGVGPGFLLSP